jgi:tRNA U34 2-thiouridine synthase MnmA/TrmU
MGNEDHPLLKKPAKALALFSGGLDSSIAVKVIQDQGIEVLGVTFTTPFFGAEKAEGAARRVGIPLLILDITGEHLAMVRAPRYGYGRNMNPCIDCHTLMFKIAGRQMEERGFDFILSGEVLGQRPMSQNKQMLHVVAKNSGYEPWIVRPLSAKLLPETRPETEGKVDRGRLLDIHGRGRKRQMELARHYGITEYTNPAGGCLLTDPMFSKRLRDLFNHDPDPSVRDIELLKVGRHIRLDGTTKVVVGRKKAENNTLMNLARPEDAVINIRDFPGPVCLVPRGGIPAMLEEAASICVSYGDAPAGADVAVRCRIDRDTRLMTVRAVPKESFQSRVI